MSVDRVIEYCIKELLKGRKDLEKIKKEAALLFKSKRIPKNSEILKAFPEKKLNAQILKVLKRKPIRTLSGVSPLAVMVKPGGSCKWNCIYCPFTGKAPKSYTGNEPAALRAKALNFDPKMQVRARLNHYKIQGHPTDKIEVIVMGGTFLAMDKGYRRWFIKSIYDELNRKVSRNIPHAKRINEKAKHRVVGLTLETRPDVCGIKEINESLYYGATRMELGVQHPDDKIYRIIKRGHLTKHVVNATALLKDSAFKVVYHIMPGLPGSNKKKDIEMVKKLFSDQRFMPDMLKIYPTLVIPGTELYEMYKRGEYKPLTAEEARDLIVEMYKYVPYFVRIMRIQRDIPSNLIFEGVKKSNLRQMVEEKLKEENIDVKEIRFREAGILKKQLTKPEMFVEEYKASNGKEFFISFESKDRDVLYGFIRLRIPGTHTFRKEIDENTGLIRELHVYGSEVSIGKKGIIQHKGLGSKLLKEAERISKEQGMDKVLVISGSGVREYYFKRGYRRDGPYVSRRI